MKVYLVAALLVLSACAAAEPRLHWVNTGMNNRDITLSPDGNTLLTTIMSPKNLFAAIAVSHRVNGSWTQLEIASFSGQYQDIEAMFTPDGKHLYFSSKRPRQDREGDDWDIWRVKHEDGEWSEPENLNSPVNTEGDEFYPSIANNNNLYFTATRDDGKGSEDIFRAIYENGSYSRVENLGVGVNTKTYEFNAFVAPDESYLIFGSQRREGEIGGGDLYFSLRKNGIFQKAQLLGKNVNTKRLDYCPYVFQGRFYFTSERTRTLEGVMDYQSLSKAFNSPGNGLGDIYSVPLSDLPLF